MKKAIVIGATSGIGRELAMLLAENNYQVGITGRRTELLESLKEEKPDSFYWRSFDITDIKATVENLEALIAELGGLDLLVISSGIGDVNRDLDFEIEKQAIDLNVFGFTAICDWSFKYFEGQKHGHLTAITSIAGLRGSSLAPAYSATKSFQIKYLESLRLKAKGTKLPIYIADIRPGFVDTAMAKGEGLFWVASPHKAALQIYKAIVRKRAVAYVTKRWKIVALIFKLWSR
jgi:short-subunit dehydrogenase